MNMLPHAAGRRCTSVSTLAAIIAAVTIPIPGAIAQAPDTESKTAEARTAPETVEIVFITHATAQNDLNDIQTALRNMLPRTKLYAVSTQNAISIRGTAEDVQLAKRIIADLDKPRQTYRVTYTITDIDNGKRMGSHSLDLTVVTGEKTVMKHGNRVPIVTGMFDKETSTQNSQVQYLDVGLNIEAYINGSMLRSKVEQSSVSDERSGIGAQDPVVGQTLVEGTFNIAAGKPFVLGSLDIPGSTRRQEIEVRAESMP